MTWGMKRVISAFLVTMLTVLLTVGFVGCGPSNEEIVRQGVTEQLDCLKNHDSALLEELAASVEAEELADYGVDAQTFIASFLDGFDYRIDNVSIEGDTATANVVFTCKSFSSFRDNMTAATDTLLADESAANWSEEELNQAIGTSIMESIASVPVSESSPLSLSFMLKDNVWTPAPENEQIISDALLGS